MSEELVNMVVDGRSVAAPPSMSIIKAVWHAGHTRVRGVGCLQGVCGTCRVMVRRADSRDVTMELACETLAEEGMQVNYIGFLETRSQHRYQIEDFKSSWDSIHQVREVFPEGPDCRHCGGCDLACPRGLDVQKGVNLAAGSEGVTIDLIAAAMVFDECVMCNLCTDVCPENIAPNHLGLLARRVTASRSLRPTNLITRLEEIGSGAMTIEDERLN